MMTKLIAFAKKWTLPLDMLAGVAVRRRKIAGRYFNDYIACGQGFGQKNTLLAIWVAYTYLSPVISIAPSSYILFQNIVNSWQLWQRETGRL